MTSDTRTQLLGYDVVSIGLSDCVAEIFGVIKKRQGARWLACINPHSYAVATRDKLFCKALKTADWLVPDGVGVTAALRLLRRPIRGRVTGPDFFIHFTQRLNDQGGCSVFFLGSTNDTLEAIRRRMSREYPHIRIVGTYSPPFASEFTEQENADMIAAVNRAGPDVLWVGLTAPKQEKWLLAHARSLNVGFAAAVGAVFDFYSGRIKAVPPVAHRLGVVWLLRLLQEPRRLWQRTFVSAPIFAWHVLRALIQERTGT